MKLRQEYDLTMRVWGEVVFSPTGLIENADQVRLAAFDARNEAASRLATHQVGCATCRREQIRVIRRRFGKDHLQQGS
jgi:hypothetical protein